MFISISESQYSTTSTQRFYPAPHPSAIYTAHVIPTVPTHHVAGVAPPPQPVAPPPTSVAAAAITTTEREREREREQREREREQRESREREREREREAPPVSKPGHVPFTPQSRPPSHTQCKQKVLKVLRPAHNGWVTC